MMSSAPLHYSPNDWGYCAYFLAERIFDIHRIKLDSCDFVKRSDWKLKYQDLIVSNSGFIKNGTEKKPHLCSHLHNF